MSEIDLEDGAQNRTSLGSKISDFHDVVTDSKHFFRLV
jgi:hypothetical protein